MPPVVVTLLTRPGCHLCDDARSVVTSVLEELRSGASAVESSLVETSIADEPALLDRYAEDIPVVLIDGAVHGFWRFDPARLRTAVRAATEKE